MSSKAAEKTGSVDFSGVTSVVFDQDHPQFPPTMKRHGVGPFQVKGVEKVPEWAKGLHHGQFVIINLDGVDKQVSGALLKPL